MITKLMEWQQHGLLTQTQLSAIQAYELTKISSNRVLRSFVFLGIFSIALGLISVSAANWFTIPDAVKLTVDFALLAVLAVVGVRTYHHPQTYRYDAVLLGYGFCVMATIGLLSQIFHTRGELYEAILLWSALTLPLFLTARHQINPLLWLGLTLPALIVGLSPEGNLLFTTGAQTEYVFLILMMTTTLILVSMSQFLVDHELTRRLGLAAKKWTPLYGLATVFFSDLLIAEGRHTAQMLTSTLLPYLVLYALMVLFSALAIYRNVVLSTARKYCLLLLLFSFSLLLALVDLGLRSPFLGAVSSITLLSLAALYYGSGDNRQWFSLVALLIGLRLFVVYLQVIGTLMMTGLGLIMTGVIIVVLASLWARHTQFIQAWLKRSFQ